MQRYPIKKNRFKIIRLSLLSLALVIIGIFFIFITDFSGGREPVWGVTFSRSYALDLQLDWQQTYVAILDELGVKHLRLSAYWDEIEPDKAQYRFDDLDWQIEQAARRGVAITLAVGRRLPRWPECHDPSWVKDLTPTEADEAVSSLITTVIKRYQANPAITTWQVENEPLFSWFGFCPPPDEKFLSSEVALVRSLDPNRPVLLTDSGELNSWQGVARYGDIVGTTLYRVVWNKWTGFFSYWYVPPAYYRWKADFTAWRHPNVSTVIVSELQMEPWTLNKRMVELTMEEQQRSFDLDRFKKNIHFVRATGFPQVYLWGAEYWYWLKQQGQPELWDEAKGLWP